MKLTMNEEITNEEITTYRTAREQSNMEQVNEATNNEAALVGTAPQKESAYTLKKVASTTSQKMLKAQARDDSDVASVKKEDRSFACLKS